MIAPRLNPAVGAAVCISVTRIARKQRGSSTKRTARARRDNTWNNTAYSSIQLVSDDRRWDDINSSIASITHEGGDVGTTRLYTRVYALQVFLYCPYIYTVAPGI